MELEKSLLLNQFHEFYSEVICQKRMIQSYTESLPQEEAPESGEAPSEKEGIHTVSLKLLSLLEEQALEAGRRGGEYGVRFYREAQYIMAALADEIFLNMDWEEREAWKSNLLEFKLFGTHVLLFTSRPSLSAFEENSGTWTMGASWITTAGSFSPLSFTRTRTSSIWIGCFIPRRMPIHWSKEEVESCHMLKDGLWYL